MSKKLSQLEKKYAPLEEKKNSIKTKIEKFKSDLQMKVRKNFFKAKIIIFLFNFYVFVTSQMQ